MTALRFFRRTGDSAAYPRATPAGRHMHQTTAATQRHRVRRYDTGPDGHPRITTDREEGGAIHSVQAAGSVSELQAQVGRLIAVFESEHGREPDLRDEEFWRAYQRLVEAYAGERSGADEAFEPIAKGADR